MKPVMTAKTHGLQFVQALVENMGVGEMMDVLGFALTADFTHTTRPRKDDLA